MECDFKSGECLTRSTYSSTVYSSTGSTAGSSSSTFPTSTINYWTSSVLESSTSPTPETTTNHLLHIHKIDAKSTDNSKAINVLNNTIANLESNVKNLEKQVDEHKKIIVTSTTETISVHLLELSSSLPNVLISSNDQPEIVQPSQRHFVEIPNDPPEIVIWPPETVLHENVSDRIPQLDPELDRHASLSSIILILVMILLAAVILASICYLWHHKSATKKPHATELHDIKTIDKPLPGR